nr:MAG TPA: hypothetical protein [Caudoviricetes sp.]
MLVPIFALRGAFECGLFHRQRRLKNVPATARKKRVV